MEANLEKSEDFPTSSTSLYSRISTNLAIIHVAPIVEHYETTRTELNKSLQGMRLSATKTSEPWHEDLNGKEKPKAIRNSIEGTMAQKGSKVRKRNDHARVSIR